MLIGGGIGITPLLGMLDRHRRCRAPREAWVLYGVRDNRDYIMRTQLETIARTHANVHLRVFLFASRHGAMDGPDIQVGHIDLDAMKRLLPSKAYDFYVCGPPAMMDSVTRDLQAWGVPTDRVHTGGLRSSNGQAGCSWADRSARLRV